LSPSRLVCESRIHQVVVYARGAVVTRRVSLPEALPLDPVDLVIPAITFLAEPGSLRASVDGGRDVVALRARHVFPAAPVAPGALAERVRALTFAYHGSTSTRW
jgi:hypothetical protein